MSKAQSLLLSPVFVVLIFTGLATGQTRPDKEEQEETIEVSSDEVLLDAVVRDKRGRAVRDLTASDFEVYEDGVRQNVRAFRLVTREGRTGAPATNANPAVDSANDRGRITRTPDQVARAGAMALVFDRLSPDARARARLAALGYVGGDTGTNPATNDIFGVFGIDQALSVLQEFTTDLQLVRRAVEQGGRQAPAQFASTSAQVRAINENTASLARRAAALETVAATAAAQGNDAQVNSAAEALAANAAQQQINLMTARSLETFEALERDQQGYATTNALLSLIDGLRRLRGRKAIIFFSEGLALPPAVEARFRAVISNANRANVSIYTVDAAGLRTESANRETARDIAAIADARVRQQATGQDDRSGRPMSATLERNEDLLRSNPESGLGQLAAETGGFLVNNTNDFAGRLRLVDEDLHAYYELRYSPTNRTYDGRFRRISLKLKRPDLDVRSRQGYYAIGGAIASPVLAYEAPALGAASKTPLPNAFPTLALALNFPEPARPGLTTLLVEAPFAAVTPTSDKSKESLTDFTIVVLVKDEAQRVVRKVSRQYALNVPAGGIAAMRGENILLYREEELPPGRYTVEAVAYDAPSGNASVRRGTLEVPQPDKTKVSLSSVVIIKRVERMAAAANGVTPTSNERPLRFEDTLIYPNLGEPVRRGANQPLAFFVTVYPAAAGASQPPKLTIEVLRAGRTTGRASAALPAPDRTNRIQYASALPTDKMQPGEYELRLTVDDGQSTAMRSARFTVAP